MNTRSIVFFISVAMALLFAWFFILPSMQSIDAAQKAIETSEQDIAVLQEAGEELEDASAFFASITSEEKELIELAAPSSPEKVNAAVVFENIAEDNGLQVDSIEVNQVGTSSRDTGITRELSVSINASGSYSSVKAFITRLERSLRIFDMKEISLEPGDDGLLTLGIQGTIYYFNVTQ